MHFPVRLLALLRAGGRAVRIRQEMPNQGGAPIVDMLALGTAEERLLWLTNAAVPALFRLSLVGACSVPPFLKPCQPANGFENGMGRLVRARQYLHEVLDGEYFWILAQELDRVFRMSELQPTVSNVYMCMKVQSLTLSARLAPLRAVVIPARDGCACG